jgi:hypothetical protein
MRGRGWGPAILAHVHLLNVLRLLLLLLLLLLVAVRVWQTS